MSFRVPRGETQPRSRGVIVRTVQPEEDTDAPGPPCLKCGDCPGFNLHFWRKICTNCKCLESDHELDGKKERVAEKVVGKLFQTNAAANVIRKESKRHDDLKQSLSSQGIKPRKSSTGMKRQSLSPSQGLSRHNLSKSGTSIASTEEEAPSKHESVFSFVPKNTSDDLVEEFMESLEEKAPKIGTDGQVERQKQLMIQLPMHDIDSRACKTKLTPDEIEEMEDFHEKRQLHALGQGTVDKVAVLDTIPSAATKDDREEGEEGEEVEWSCHECKQPMKSSEVAVFAERVGPDVCWHPKCFVCSTCKELLVDLIYFCKDGEIMCGRHHAETIKPRCKACDELIFAEEYTHAEQADWHISHFCCWECDMLLGGKRYIAKEGKPYCLDCYTLKFGKKCETCGTQISADAPHLSHKDKTWHGTDECFCCFTCKKALIGKPFLPRLDHIFCSKVCYRTHQKAEMATKALE